MILNAGSLNVNKRGTKLSSWLFYKVSTSMNCVCVTCLYSCNKVKHNILHNNNILGSHIYCPNTSENCDNAMIYGKLMQFLPLFGHTTSQVDV